MKRKQSRLGRHPTRTVRRLQWANVVLLAIALLGIAWVLLAADPVSAQETTDAAGIADARKFGFLAAALSTGLAAIGAAYAVAHVGAASVGAISEKPELAGRTLIFVGLAEGIAIYGLILSVMILGRI